MRFCESFFDCHLTEHDRQFLCVLAEKCSFTYVAEQGGRLPDLPWGTKKAFNATLA